MRDFLWPYELAELEKRASRLGSMVVTDPLARFESFNGIVMALEVCSDDGCKDCPEFRICRAAFDSRCTAKENNGS